MSSAPVTHPYALFAPWYVHARMPPPKLVTTIRQPSIQKYDADDFVEQIMRDPSESLAFEPEDRWTYPVPRAIVVNPPPSFSSYLNVRSKLRKLFQPSHQRFYAVAIELFCDEIGFPRPQQTPRVEVGFVVRRLTVPKLTGPITSNLRKAARAIATDDLGRMPFRGTLSPPSRFNRAHKAQFEADDVLRLSGQIVSAKPDMPLALAAMTTGTEAWLPEFRTWLELPDDRKDALQHPVNGEPVEEQIYSMWAVPSHSPECPRSIWFGVIPTFASETAADGTPKLDDQAIYVIRCFVRVAPPPGHEHCPPKVYWSEPTEPYRVAAFFDPEGTAHRRTNLRMPDLRTLAAMAPDHRGGVHVSTPPSSGLPIVANGSLPSKSGSPADVPSMSFPVELLTIVAMFVFSIFLPIVMFLFQLWWMLFLQFSWPNNGLAKSQLDAWVAAHQDEFMFPPPNDHTFKDPTVAGVDQAANAAAQTPAGQPSAPGRGNRLPPVSDPLCSASRR